METSAVHDDFSAMLGRRIAGDKRIVTCSFKSLSALYLMADENSD